MIGDELAGALPELQAHTESRMGSENSGSDAIVRRKTGQTAQNEETGAKDPVWVVVHEGPMRLKGATRNSSGTRSESVPGGEVQLATREAHFPIAVNMIRDGDFIEITAGGNAGTVWRVLEADHADQQTARRLPVVSEKRPTEWG